MGTDGEMSSPSLSSSRSDSMLSCSTPRGPSLPVAMDGMIAAASAHFRGSDNQECSPRPDSGRQSRNSSRARTPRDENARADSRPESAARPQFPFAKTEVRLDDYADSFPLVPMPVIPQLGFDDLRQLFCGLEELLASLQSSVSAEDQQLAKYAERQISVVQRQFEQLRAQERVRALLVGDIEIMVAPLPVRKTVVAAETATTQPDQPSAAPRPIFLMPTPSPSKPSHSNQGPRPASKPPAALDSRTPTPAPIQPKLASSSSAHHLRNKRDTLERAKALVRANISKPSVSSSSSSAIGTVSPFVISSGTGGSKKRRLPAKKLTPEEATKARALQVEKEREQRRQAAYQRLLARQELQAKKKEQTKAKRADTGGKDPTATQTNAKENRASPATTHDSDSESDASDVSNLSDGDAEDEQQIMAMKVESPRPIFPEEMSDEDDNSTDNANGDEHTRGSENDQPGKNTEYAMCDIGSFQEAPTEQPKAPPIRKLPIFLQPDVTENVSTTITLRPENIGFVDSRYEDQSQLSCPPEDDDEKLRAAVALDLQHFMSARAAAKMQELEMISKSEKEVTMQEKLNEVADGNEPKTDADVSENQLPKIGSMEKTQCEGPEPDTAEKFESSPCKTLNGPQEERIIEQNSVEQLHERDTKEHHTPDTQTDTPLPEVQSTNIVALPTQVRTKCSDYREYFGSFHCILTSAYEQRLACSAQSSSRDSLTPSASVHPPNDNTLRLQLKLYQGWQSIMQDYATVFGSNITAPSSMLPSTSPFTAHYRINSTTRKEVCEIVTTALEKLGDWEEHASGLGLKTTWNLLWTWSKPRVERKTLLAWQKVNHFQHCKALTRKDCLKKNIGKYLAMGGKMKQAYECFVPKTFLLPQEYVAFVQAFQARVENLNSKTVSRNNIWIMKPVALSRGRGISLVNDLSDVVYGEQVVIQEYVSNPLLLDGYKFDLRLYVLVTSFNPLEAFFYEDGFVRICTRQYHDGDLGDLFVHLTNSSIQKENQDAISTSDNPINEADGQEAGGTKMTISYLWKRLEAMGADVDKVRRDIDEVILKSLLCGEDHIPFQVNSFDLLGYDILLDANFRPWLIEINASPSMARENALDFQVFNSWLLQSPRPNDSLVVHMVLTGQRCTYLGHDQARESAAIRSCSSRGRPLAAAS